MFSLAPALPSDSSLLAEFAERSYRATFSRDNRAEDMDDYCRGSFGEALQLREILDPARVVMIARFEGKIVGYSQLIRGSRDNGVTESRPIELQRLYVDAPYKGQGLAWLLMEEALRVSRAEAFDVLWLGVWEKNARARRFYAKWNFIEVGEHIFWMGKDPQRDLILARRLAAM